MNFTEIGFCRASGSSPVAPVMAGPLIVFFFSSQSFCMLTFCAACTLSVMYNISFMLKSENVPKLAYLGI